MPITSRRYVRLTGLADSANIRTAVFDNDTYTVVPIMALKGNVVIRPMGSKGPEFVPASVLEISTILWKNRPAVLDHPIVDGEPVSANDPEILEQYRIGHIFNPSYDDGLIVEAYLNDDMAASVGEDAVTSLTALQAGETVEVSVGAIVVVEKQSGEYDGVSYEYVWLEIYPDHLAILPFGKTGACSNDMGCGPITANNGSTSHLQLRAAQGVYMNNLSRQAQLAFRRLMLNNESSDAEWRKKLSAALHQIEPSFDWLMDHYQKQKVVVYETWSDGKITTYQRSYKIDGDGNVEFKSDAVEVIGFQPVTRAAGDGNLATSLTHSDTNVDVANNPTTQPTTGEPLMADNKRLVDKIINCTNCMVFDETSRATLSLMTDEQLKGLFDKFNPKVVEPVEPVVNPVALTQPAIEPVAPVAPVTQATVVVPAADWKETQEVVAAAKKSNAAYRSSLIAALAIVNNSYTEEFFDGWAIDKVEVVHAAHGLNRPAHITQGRVDFAVANSPSVTHVAERKEIPNSYAALTKKA